MSSDVVGSGVPLQLIYSLGQGLLRCDACRLSFVAVGSQWEENVREHEASDVHMFECIKLRAQGYEPLSLLDTFRQQEEKQQQEEMFVQRLGGTVSPVPTMDMRLTASSVRSADAKQRRPPVPRVVPPPLVYASDAPAPASASVPTRSTEREHLSQQVTKRATDDKALQSSSSASRRLDKVFHIFQTNEPGKYYCRLCATTVVNSRSSGTEVEKSLRSHEETDGHLQQMDKLLKRGFDRLIRIGTVAEIQKVEVERSSGRSSLSAKRSANSAKPANEYLAASNIGRKAPKAAEEADGHRRTSTQAVITRDYGHGCAEKKDKRNDSPLDVLFDSVTRRTTASTRDDQKLVGSTRLLTSNYDEFDRGLEEAMRTVETARFEAAKREEEELQTLLELRRHRDEEEKRKKKDEETVEKRRRKEEDERKERERAAKEELRRRREEEDKVEQEKRRLREEQEKKEQQRLKDEEEKRERKEKERQQEEERYLDTIPCSLRRQEEVRKKEDVSKLPSKPAALKNMPLFVIVRISSTQYYCRACMKELSADSPLLLKSHEEGKRHRLNSIVLRDQGYDPRSVIDPNRSIVEELREVEKEPFVVFAKIKEENFKHWFFCRACHDEVWYSEDILSLHESTQKHKAAICVLENHNYKFSKLANECLAQIERQGKVAAKTPAKKPFRSVLRVFSKTEKGGQTVYHCNVCPQEMLYSAEISEHEQSAIHQRKLNDVKNAGESTLADLSARLLFLEAEAAELRRAKEVAGSTNAKQKSSKLPLGGAAKKPGTSSLYNVLDAVSKWPSSSNQPPPSNTRPTVALDGPGKVSLPAQSSTAHHRRQPAPVVQAASTAQKADEPTTAPQTEVVKSLLHQMGVDEESAELIRLLCRELFNEELNEQNLKRVAEMANSLALSKSLKQPIQSKSEVAARCAEPTSRSVEEDRQSADMEISDEELQVHPKRPRAPSPSTTAYDDRSHGYLGSSSAIGSWPADFPAEPADFPAEPADFPAESPDFSSRLRSLRRRTRFDQPPANRPYGSTPHRVPPPVRRNIPLQPPLDFHQRELEARGEEVFGERPPMSSDVNPSYLRDGGAAMPVLRRPPPAHEGRLGQQNSLLGLGSLLGDGSLLRSPPSEVREEQQLRRVQLTAMLEEELGPAAADLMSPPVEAPPIVDENEQLRRRRLQTLIRRELRPTAAATSEILFHSLPTDLQQQHFIDGRPSQPMDEPPSEELEAQLMEELRAGYDRSEDFLQHPLSLEAEHRRDINLQHRMYHD